MEVIDGQHAFGVQLSRTRSVVCLDAECIWQSLISVNRGSSETSRIVARVEKVTEQIVQTCQRLIPVILVVKEDDLGCVPFKELRDNFVRREVQVLVVASDTRESTCEYFFNQGCAGVIGKDAGVAVLRSSLDALGRGELWLPRRVLSKLALDAIPNSGIRRLTPREESIYQLMATGYSNQQIADTLFISRETVRWHVRSINSKFGSAGVSFRSKPSQTEPTTPPESAAS